METSQFQISKIGKIRTFQATKNLNYDDQLTKTVPQLKIKFDEMVFKFNELCNDDEFSF